jgi:Ca2+-binding RTX toxin-like protein
MDLRGFERIELVAKGGNDRIDASGLSNRVALNIDGGAGNDTISGSANADTINAGAGADNLTGGAGKDRFDYDSVLDSGTAKGSRDIIQGFDFGNTATTGDKIDLSTIDANITTSGNQAFKFIGAASFSAPGQVNVFNDSGNTIIQLNTDFDLFAESQIQVNDGATLAAHWEALDFIL